MDPAIIYFIKVNIALLLFYAFYRLFFYKDTFFHLRRLSLISFFVLALLYPFLHIQDWVSSKEPIAEAVFLYSGMLPEIVVSPAKAISSGWGITLSACLKGIYFAGILFLGVRFLVRLGSIVGVILRSEVKYLDNDKIYIPPKELPPFSFFRFVFICPPKHSDIELDEIIAHEYTHVRQWHSVDVILSEMMCIFCWCNPVVWLLKREIRCNLEYLADRKVLEKGYDSKIYQYHLLGLAHQQSGVDLYNSFNMLPIKNRIRMMNRKGTNGFNRAKYLLFIPLTGTLLIFNQVEAVARIPQELAFIKTDQNNYETRNIREGEWNAYFSVINTISASLKESLFYGSEEEDIYPPRLLESMMREAEETIYTVVDHMPVFPGGEVELLKFISQNVKYPRDAQDEGIQGRVICSFIVGRDGKIRNIELVRGITPSLDLAARKVLEMMPVWSPGLLDGKPVAVKYTVPITFRLQ